MRISLVKVIAVFLLFNVALLNRGCEGDMGAQQAYLGVGLFVPYAEFELYEATVYQTGNFFAVLPAPRRPTFLGGWRLLFNATLAGLCVLFLTRSRFSARRPDLARRMLVATVILALLFSVIRWVPYLGGWLFLGEFYVAAALTGVFGVQGRLSEARWVWDIATRLVFAAALVLVLAPLGPLRRFAKRVWWRLPGVFHRPPVGLTRRFVAVWLAVLLGAVVLTLLHLRGLGWVLEGNDAASLARAVSLVPALLVVAVAGAVLRWPRTVLVAAALPGYLVLTLAGRELFFRYDVARTKDYASTLIAQLEAQRVSTGRYPAKLEVVAEKIDPPIGPLHYTSNGETFKLYFRDPDAFNAGRVHSYLYWSEEPGWIKSWDYQLY